MIEFFKSNLFYFISLAMTVLGLIIYQFFLNKIEKDKSVLNFRTNRNLFFSHLLCCLGLFGMALNIGSKSLFFFDSLFVILATQTYLKGSATLKKLEKIRQEKQEIK